MFRDFIVYGLEQLFIVVLFAHTRHKKMYFEKNVEKIGHFLAYFILSMRSTRAIIRVHPSLKNHSYDAQKIYFFIIAETVKLVKN